MSSVWTSSIEIARREQLYGDISADVLIIGGGMAGILCAHMLQQEGADCVVAEAARIGGGITKNTTAKVTAQHGLIYDYLIKNAGLEKARQYLNANTQAVQQFRDLCANIDCDFEDEDSYVFSLTDMRQLENEAAALRLLGATAEIVRKLNLPLKTVGAIKLPTQAQFNPLQFIAHISQELRIYEDTAVRRISGNIAETDHGNISANKIIVATHFPFINRMGLYFVKMYQHRSYAIALENAQDVGGIYVDAEQNGLSFRNYGNLLIIGGGDHRTGKQGGNWRELRNFAKTHYPNATEKFAWATQDCMTLDSVPYIGHYSPSTPNLFVATGFNKWGMTSAMVSANILRDMIIGRKNEYADVFAPDRSMAKGQLLTNLGETAANFFSLKTKRCSHLGCGLTWNKCENTWDCCCHGSRFDNDGKLIDNPAMRDLK